MNSCIVFVPNNLKSNIPYFLYGFYEYYHDSDCSVFYVCEISFSLKESNLIGIYNQECVRPPTTDNYIVLKGDSSDIVLTEVIVGNKDFLLNDCIFVKYDLNSFNLSELIINANDSNFDEDYFKKLACHIKSHSIKNRKGINDLSSKFVKATMYILTSILFMMDKICMVMKYSTFAIHFKDCLRNLLSVLKSFERKQFIDLHSGNYLLATVIDMIIGAIVLHTLSSVDDIFLFFSKRAENVIDSITILVEWLMGSPAGLKLNHPLNQIIGGFFLYNINLWWTFLGLIEPVLKYGFYIFSNLGFLGFSYQIAILADLFILVTFHVYCIYIYAARLYRLQVQGLWSLSKLVIGKKRNPIPGRIDSCPYTTEQLFIGTISFTVLLFLLPTVLVYYVVFVFMRLGVVGICGIMTRTRYYIQILPVYSTLVWMFKPTLTAMTVKLDMANQFGRNGLVCWEAKATSVCWLETVEHCVPPSVLAPPHVKWTEIIHNVMTGRLIYPL